MFPYCKYTETEINNYLNNVQESTVFNSLAKSKLGFTDFLNLLSPAAQVATCEMRKKATSIKKMYFGPTIRLYSPLYISSFCINDCEYCGFRTKNKNKRKRLSFDEIIAESKIIKSYGIESLLLVSGEDPNSMSVDFLVSIVKELKKDFSYIGIEIYPMQEKDYKKLFVAGVDGLTLYQETYDKKLYEKLHNSGPKRDYENRLDFVEQGARAGFYNIGLGVLLGLDNWRSEVVSMAAHAVWLKKKYWKTKIQFSFPRITPIEGGFKVPQAISEDELEQIMLAFRIFFKESDIFISTRESVPFRNKIAATCASHFSAASKVVPGGYIDSIKEKDLGQFSLNDMRSVKKIEEDFNAVNIETIYKDWGEFK